MVKNISISRFSVIQTVRIQTIQFRISIVFVYTQLNVKTVPFQTIQFSISMQFSSIWPIDRTLSGATTLGQSRPGSNGSEGVLCIPQTSRITGTLLSDCLVSYLGHTLWWWWGLTPSAEMHLVYSTAPAN